MSQWKAALRSVIRRPAAAITTVAVMSLGIGANSALFSIVDTVVLKPLPYPQPDRIVQMLDGNPAKSERESLISPARLEDWNRLSHAFEAISGSYAENVTDTSMTEPERLAGRRVAPRFFSVFGTKALAGRTFLPDEEVSGGPAAAVISERVWTRRYQRDPSAIGKRLALSGTAYTIVGVMTKEFAAPSIDVWLPAQLSPELMRMRDARFLGGVGRMKNGMTLAQARADMRRVSAELGKEFPNTDAGWLPLVSDYKQERIGTNGRVLSLMFASAVLLLLILCANVAGLLLGHFQRREREFAIRASLGAGNSQIAAVVLREVAILAAASGAMGLAIAYAGSRWLAAVFVELPRVHELRFDWRVTVFTVASTAVTAVVFGLVPTVQAMRRDLNGVLAAGGRSQIGGRRRVQQVLVGTQFAVTLVLLVVAGLLLRSYYNLTRVDPGFRVDNVITFHVGAEWGEDRTKIGMIQQQLISDLAQTRGVEAAGITNFLPASGATLREQVSVEGLAESGDRGKITVGTRMVSAGYLRALHMPVLKGSTCPEFSPNQKRPPTAVVNRRFVEAAGGADLIGRSLSFSSMHGKPLRIVGVVGNAKEDALNAMEVPYLYACTWAGAWPDPEYVVV